MLKDRKDLRILVLFNKTLASVSSIKYVLAFVSENGEYSFLPAADEVFSAFTTRFSLLVVFFMMNWKYFLAQKQSPKCSNVQKYVK